MKKYYYIIFLILIKSIQSCKEKPIELNVENAEIILTGTVRKLERNYSQMQYGAYIEVHRIIKGHIQIYELFNLNFNENEMQKNLTKRTSKQSIYGHILFINNFGDPRICDSIVKPHDVRIFMLGIDSNQRLYLNSSLVQPTLTKIRNLNIVSENEHTFDIKSCK